MKAHRILLGGIIVGISSLFWIACSGPQFGGCDPGTEGCACAVDGGPCAAGLTCVSLRCVNLDSGSLAGSTVTTGTTGTAMTGSAGASTSTGDGGRGGAGPGT